MGVDGWEVCLPNHSHEGDGVQHLLPHYLRSTVKPTHYEFFEDTPNPSSKEPLDHWLEVNPHRDVLTLSANQVYGQRVNSTVHSPLALGLLIRGLGVGENNFQRL